MGTGFESAAYNVARINQTKATTTSANPTQLAITVPAAAGSGPISVSTPTGMATSATDFIVLPAGFSAPDVVSQRLVAGAAQSISIDSSKKIGMFPFNGAQGQSFSLALTNFSAVPSGAALTATILKPDGSTFVGCGNYSASGGTCDFGPLPSTGIYSVRFDWSGTASFSFNVVLSPDIQGSIAFNAPMATYSVALPGQNVRYAFSGAAGERASLVLAGNSIPSGTLAVYRPDGTLLSSLNYWATPEWTLDFTLPVSGAYTAVIFVNANATGSTQVGLRKDVTGAVNPDGTALPVSLLAGQNAEFTFEAVAGRVYSFAVTGFASTPGGGNVEATILRADGSVLRSCGAYSTSPNQCDFDTPTAGTHRLRLDPAGAKATTFNAFLSQDLAGALTVDGPEVTFNATVPGQNIRYTFSGTAGQHVSWSYSHNTISNGTMVIVKPDGGLLTGYLGYGGTSNGSLEVTLPMSGDYLAIVYVDYSSTGQLKTRLRVPDALSTSGTPASLTLAGDVKTYTFTAAAGRVFSLAVVNFTSNPAGAEVNAVIVRPDGSILHNCGNYSATVGQCDFGIPAAGTYRVRVSALGSATSSFDVVLSEDLAGTLVINDPPTTFNATVPGQNIRYSFAGSAGQKISWVYTNNTIPKGTLILVNPNGSLLTSYISYYGSAAGVIDVTLPVTGTYIAIIWVDGAATGQMTLRLAAEVTGSVVADGTPTSMSLSNGENAALTFTASSGLGSSVALTNFSSVPAGAVVNVSARKPDGSPLSCSGYTPFGSSPGNCDLATLTPGTYTLLLDPSGAAATSFNVVLSENLAAGSLTVNGSAATYSSSIPARNAVYTFSGTSSQTLAVDFSGNTFSYGTLFVFDANDGVLAARYLTGSTSGTLNIPALPATGSYKVVVFTDFDSTGQIDVQLRTR